MIYIKLSFPVAENELREILVAMLSDANYDGFEEDKDVFSAYIPETLFNEDAVIDLAKQFQVAYTKETILPQNWNAKWESDFEPVIVKDFCTVRASFHELKSATPYEVIITPKMSFGTGHHATTQLMIDQMRSISFEGSRVLDFGTGTGVLAILASKLGAKEIVAIDNDEWSFENAVENVEVNGCKNISVVPGSLEGVAEGGFDIVLANINRHILLHYMKALHEKLSSGGTLLLSGLLEEDFDIIDQAAREAGFSFDHKAVLNNWIVLLYNK